MDFEEQYMKEHGHGQYEELNPELLPPLFIAYRTDLAEGSEVFHNNIRERWNQGDPDIVQAMKDFASYAENVYELLQAGHGKEIGPWMDQNFDRRRSIYNLDPRNIEMVMRAREVGAHCKFAGSGGGVVGTYEDDAMYERLHQAYTQMGITLFRPTIAV